MVKKKNLGSEREKLGRLKQVSAPSPCSSFPRFSPTNKVPFLPHSLPPSPPPQKFCNRKAEEGLSVNRHPMDRRRGGRGGKRNLKHRRERERKKKFAGGKKGGGGRESIFLRG